MTYVKTQFGNIHIDDIPIVLHETTGSKFKHALMFFSIIVIIIIIMYMNYKPCRYESKNEEIVLKKSSNNILTSVKATMIDVYDIDDIYLENIIIVTTDDNIINIDILRNKYVKTIQNNNETIYSLDFKSELDIKEIIIISDKDHYIDHINIDLINRGEKVWEYSGFLQNRRENSIMISKQIFKYGQYKSDTLNNTAKTTDEKVIMNENQLSIVLSESGESDGFASY